MSSEEEGDADFVPAEEENLSDQEQPHPNDEVIETKKINKGETIPTRKRKPLNWGDLEDPGPRKIAKVEESKPEKEEIEGKLANNEVEDLSEINTKAKEEPSSDIDSIWAELQNSTAPTQSIDSNVNKMASLVKPDTKQQTKTVVLEGHSNTPTTLKKTVTVTETYDYAGESVVVTKQLEVPEPNPSQKGPRKSLPNKLDNLLDKLKGKKKLSTIEKSKIDWTKFSKNEGIVDELKRNRKDGFLEKQAFLSQTDLRQFEKEKEVRNVDRRRRANK